MHCEGWGENQLEAWKTSKQWHEFWCKFNFYVRIRDIIFHDCCWILKKQHVQKCCILQYYIIIGCKKNNPS